MRLLLLALLSVPACGGGAPGVGEAVEGELTPDDETAHAGAVIDLVPIRPAEPALVVVTAEAFVPFVIVASERAPLGAASDGDGRGACVSVPASARSDLHVYVSSAGGAGLGAYRVAVEPYSEAAARDLGCHPLPSDPDAEAETLTASSTPAGDGRRRARV